MLGNDPAALKTLESIPGLEVRPIDYSKSTGGILHAKFWIFDAERAFVGSQNLDWRALEQIQETGILFEDRSEVQKLARIFEYDWLLNDPKQTTPPPTELPTVQEPSPLPELEVLASPPRHFPVTPPGERPIRSSLTVLLDALSRARTKIQLQFLNMSPLDRSGGYWHELDVALRAAATRGVKVEILLSHWSTRAPDIDHLKSLSLLPNMSLRFLTVPEHSRGFEPYSRVIHSKLLVVDDHTAWVGTSNGSKSYFTNSRNIEVLLRAPKMVQTVRRVFEKGWNSKHTSPIDVSRSYPNPRVSL
jgi:phosphatidylserine/phosphatidylglycerophosphate/cardiolipin synthase-like enzyme